MLFRSKARKELLDLLFIVFMIFVFLGTLYASYELLDDETVLQMQRNLKSIVKP